MNKKVVTSKTLVFIVSMYSLLRQLIVLRPPNRHSPVTLILTLTSFISRTRIVEIVEPKIVTIWKHLHTVFIGWYS